MEAPEENRALRTTTLHELPGQLLSRRKASLPRMYAHAAGVSNAESCENTSSIVEWS